MDATISKYPLAIGLPTLGWKIPGNFRAELCVIKDSGTTSTRGEGKQEQLQ